MARVCYPLGWDCWTMGGDLLSGGVSAGELILRMERRQKTVLSPSCMRTAVTMDAWESLCSIEETCRRDFSPNEYQVLELCGTWERLPRTCTRFGVLTPSLLGQIGNVASSIPLLLGG